MKDHEMNQPRIKRDSIITGVINSIMNGLTYWFSNEQGGNVLLTSDMISSTEHTVMAGAVPLAVSLAFILTSISYFTWKLPGKPAYFPVFFRMALKHSIFAFGLVVILGVLFQRFAGSVHVSTLIASVITGFIAGIAGGTISYLTNSELLNYSMRVVKQSDKP
jgi:putative flippase GtrA